MRETFNPYDLHWGESDLNVPERTGGGRNDSAIASFLDWVEAKAHTFFIQTCGHTASRRKGNRYVSDTCPEHVEQNCRAVTAIFYAQPSDTVPDEQKLPEMRAIANAVGVPLFVITHHPYDYDFEYPVRIDRYIKGRRVEHSGTDWDSVGEVLRREQFHHEDALAASGEEGGRLHPRCDSRRVSWMEAMTGKARTVEGVDLTLSRIIREIPGVRHIDIDAALICPDCGKPYCMIEGTSDGLGAREAKRKAGFMTRSIAEKFRAKTLMIHHQINDTELESEVRVKTFRAGRYDPERDEVGDWDVAAAELDRILDYHQHVICRGGHR